MPRIASKQYLHMVDLASWLVDDPTSAARDRALVDYQECIGWPWRATAEQGIDWNERSMVWDALVDAKLHGPS